MVVPKLPKPPRRSFKLRRHFSLVGRTHFFVLSLSMTANDGEYTGHNVASDSDMGGVGIFARYAGSSAYLCAWHGKQRPGPKFWILVVIIVVGHLVSFLHSFEQEDIRLADFQAV